MVTPDHNLDAQGTPSPDTNIRRPSLAPSLACTLVNFDLTPGSSQGPSRAASTEPLGLQMTSIQAGYRFGSRREDEQRAEESDGDNEDEDDEEHGEDGPRRGSSATDKTLFSGSTTDLNGKLMGFSPLKKGSDDRVHHKIVTASSSATRLDLFESGKCVEDWESQRDLENGPKDTKPEDQGKTLHQQLKADNAELYRILEGEGLMLDKIHMNDAVSSCDPARLVLVASPLDHQPDLPVGLPYTPARPMPKTFSTARKTVIVCLASWITVLVCMCASGFSTGAHVVRDEFGLVELEGMEKESGHSSEWVWGTFGGLGLYLVSPRACSGLKRFTETDTQ